MQARIKEARRRVAVSQEEFAARLGVSRGAVAQWEMDDGTSPTVKNLEQIATLSGLAFEWLATGRGPKVFGQPMVREPEAIYHAGLSDEEQQVVSLMRKMKPPKRAALVQLIQP
jgi:transcriptional regulator with XRE-family HTH domain